MKILLMKNRDIGNINTRLPESINKVQGVYPPLGIAYIAAVLESQGHKLGIIDVHAENLTTDELSARIRAFKPDLVGATAMTSNFIGALDALRLSKEIFPDVPTVIGGPHLDAYPLETMTHNEIDYAVVGEGEVVVPKLIDVVRGKKSALGVSGLIHRKKGGSVKFVNKEVAYVKDLDSLPFPARHFLPNDKYETIIAQKPFTTAMTSRGCPFNCDYCFRSASMRKVRFRSPKNVVDEVQECYEKYKTRSFWFYDDTFTLISSHVKGICDGIIERGLKIDWECLTRVDRVKLETFQLMRRSGCTRVRLGLESGDPRILASMHKGTTVSQGRNAVALAKKAGIETFGFFMLGYPHETDKSMERTIQFAKDSGLDWAMFSMTTPYPRTRLYQQAFELGILKSDYWAEFTLGKAKGRIPFFRNDLDEWTKKAYRSFYFRPQFAIERIAKLRSIGQAIRFLDGFFALVRYEMLPKDDISKEFSEGAKGHS